MTHHMSMDTKKDVLKSVRTRKYVNKSFDGLRQDIIEYARTYYDDRIRDFSESGLGGVLVDLAAFVGDNLSFYLDHQFSELSSEDAVEGINIERLLREAGVKITGAAPSIVECSFFIEVPAEPDGFGGQRPMNSVIPIVQEDTVVIADNGTQFVLLEPIDFSETDRFGNMKANVRFGTTSAAGTPLTYIMDRSGFCLSGFKIQESFPIGADFVAFREITLANPNVTEITHVGDDQGNTYYEVDQLTQDVVYRGVLNRNEDDELVKENLTVIPAPFRFTRKTAVSSRLTTLVFGGGSADTLDDDIIPDPTDFALPLYGKRTFTRTSIDPGSMLRTRTLGVAASNTTLTVTYQYGGGLSHNVSSDSITAISTLRMTFPNGPSAAAAQRVRSSTDVKNFKRASGGDDPPEIDELKSLIPSVRNAQSRIVTKEDLLSRVYTLPSNFGRVFRAGIRSNPNNPLVTELYIISRDQDGQLIIAPDTLKKNLARYLNQYRMISDAIDVFDARVINLQVFFKISVDPGGMNKNIVLQNILVRLNKFFDSRNFNIDQPIVLSDIRNLIFNNPGVISVNQLKIVGITGLLGANQYGDTSFDVDSNTRYDMVIPPPGGIFEVKFPEIDIIGAAI